MGRLGRVSWASGTHVVQYFYSASLAIIQLDRLVFCWNFHRITSVKEAFSVQLWTVPCLNYPGSNILEREDATPHLTS